MHQANAEKLITLPPPPQCDRRRKRSDTGHQSRYGGKLRRLNTLPTTTTTPPLPLSPAPSSPEISAVSPSGQLAPWDPDVINLLRQSLELGPWDSRLAGLGGGGGREGGWGEAGGEGGCSPWLGYLLAGRGSRLGVVFVCCLAGCFRSTGAFVLRADG